jgi:hypothetical protein
MDGKDIATLVLAGFGLVLTLGQIYVARGQRALQDATNQGAQVSAWNSLSRDWQLALLVSVGPDRAIYEGVHDVDVNGYRHVLNAYMKAEGASAEAYISSNAGEDWERLHESVRLAREQMQPYKAAVGRVLTHLAHVAGLVFRGNLSVSSAYNALGWSLIRYRHCIDVLTKLHPSAQGCPGGYIPEYANLPHMSPDEASQRVGWATELAEHPGQLVRIRMLADLMTAVAMAEGDVYGLRHGPSVGYVSSDDRALLQSACRRVSRRQSLGILWKLDRRAHSQVHTLDGVPTWRQLGSRLRAAASFPRRWRPLRSRQAQGVNDLWLKPRESDG